MKKESVQKEKRIRRYDLRGRDAAESEKLSEVNGV